VFSVVKHSPVSLNEYVYPSWADGLGWLMFTVSVAMIPLVAVMQIVKVFFEDSSLSSLVW